MNKYKANYHLPGLFEFYDFYCDFLPIYKNHREFFYEWCEIGSIYGAPADCIWGGGRIETGKPKAEEALELVNAYGISARLTFSNSLLREEHLQDARCNQVCELFAHRKKFRESGALAANDMAELMDGLEMTTSQARNGIIVHSDLLLADLREKYPDFDYISSTTKVQTQEEELLRELKREEFSYVVPDFRFNKDFALWGRLSAEDKGKIELLCNECCWVGCKDRKVCYETVSRKNLGEDCPEHICKAPGGNEGYVFSKAMENPTFIGIEDIVQEYLPRGICNFKIEGRGLGSAIVLEMLLYYMIKPQYQLRVREGLYLDSMLDLF